MESYRYSAIQHHGIALRNHAWEMSIDRTTAYVAFSRHRDAMYGCSSRSGKHLAAVASRITKSNDILHRAPLESQQLHPASRACVLIDRSSNAIL